MTKYVLFDVGANAGQDSLERTKTNPNVECWAFEPTPELLVQLASESESFKDRYHIFDCAISDFNGQATFNVADNLGCNSLNTFSDGLDRTWPGRTDFKVVDTIDVQVRRLDDWFREVNPNIDRIDYFHCDTQGCDLKVLQGMGEFLHLIQEGMVECARDTEVQLYKENHTIEDMISFLSSNGFEIIEITSGDWHNNEFNLHFKKK